MTDIAEGEICLVAAGTDDVDDSAEQCQRWTVKWRVAAGGPTWALVTTQTGLHWSPVVDTPLTLVLSCVNSVNHTHTETQTQTHTHTNKQSHHSPLGEQLPCRSWLSLDELHGYPEFTCVLIRLEEMIGCSQHRSKEGPDAYTNTHAQTHTRLRTHTHMGIHIHKALVDSNALGRAPSHHVKRHTSAEFGFCHMWFTRRQTTSHPSLLSVQIYLPPSPVYLCVCLCVLQYFLHLSQQHMLCCRVYVPSCSYECSQWGPYINDVCFMCVHVYVCIRVVSTETPTELFHNSPKSAL